MIDLTEIMTNFKESIDLDNEYDLSSTITSGDILDLSKITLKGKIEKDGRNRSVPLLAVFCGGESGKGFMGE